ncbi:hypothetical protein [uncultured Tateyamaria sp.]|uniref:hypothetical protein n=1 Tax=uncultured Tateyamaria sp. TaxID=455651 RepID=UPI002617E416|nr:hypothetical protein [uncultured Tateyamaria sp.]
MASRGAVCLDSQGAEMMMEFTDLVQKFTSSPGTVKNFHNKIVSIQPFIPFFSALRMITTNGGGRIASHPPTALAV